MNEPVVLDWNASMNDSARGLQNTSEEDRYAARIGKFGGPEKFQVRLVKRRSDEILV